MRARCVTFVLLLLAVSFSAIAQAPCMPCEKLKDLRIPDVTILNVESKPSDNVRPPEPWMGPVVITKPFCRVTGRISTEINFELYLPQEWNGRFLMSGGGGYVGAI